MKTSTTCMSTLTRMTTKIIILLSLISVFSLEAKKAKESIPPEKQKQEIFKWIRTTSEIISLVEEKSFRTIDFSNFFQTMLKAGIASLDAHSALLPNFEEVSESLSGKFSGIGISIISKSNEDDHLMIVDVIDGGPSEKAGLQGGDKIVEVDGEKLRGLSSDEVIDKIKGEVGTIVKLKIIRTKNPLEFSVKRDIIKEQSSEYYRFNEQNIDYLGLKIFNELSPKQMKDLLVKANKGDSKGIILDLRRNPGGVLESVVEMSGLMLPKGSKVVITKDRKGKVASEHFTKTDPVLKRSVPIFILINNFTASASEILAGALRHYSREDNEVDGSELRVFLVGTTTFGKGSVQEVIPVSNGCALKQTSLLYFLPDGSSIQATGIEPDFLIKPKTIPTMELKWLDEFNGKETSLRHHITQDEIKKINEGKFPGYAHEIDKETRKKQAAEESKKTENDELEEKGEKILDKKTLAKKRTEAISLDIQIQACFNMINLLNMAERVDKNLVNTHKNALEFLKKNYLVDTPMPVIKVE